MPHHVECSQWLGIAWEGTGRWRIWMWMQRWRCLSVVHRRQKRHKSSATSALANENFVAFCISEVATRRSKMQSSISHVENNSGTKYEKRTQTGRRELKKYNRGSTCHTAHSTCMRWKWLGCGLKMLEKLGGNCQGEQLAWQTAPTREWKINWCSGKCRECRKGKAHHDRWIAREKECPAR